ncbi:MAG: phosphodiester glycosidase family protein [Eubacteriales bacterium]|jgi:exopolysaccharide biosynthesis protein|nr:phosphodiester glycosidase family protein [Eubacteriales bacterium]MDD3571627.1 phosphodiester glycosidase family protein [Eubacteriales bacterium]NLO12924.1 phosphodiester glycosidase family protein [Clostridiales bacterium]
MSTKTRNTLIILTLVMALALPFWVPSGALLDHEAARLDEELWQEEEGDDEVAAWLMNWLIPSASAQEDTALPIDFSPGPAPDPAGFTDTSYEDDSIVVRLETIQQEGVVWRLARVDITHPSQLRTAAAGSLTSRRTKLISTMAREQNAVIAINANYFADQPDKKSFEYRMGERVRAKYNRIKDLLITDENGDFHLFVRSDKSEVQAFLNAGHTIVNAFTFGPALVKDGMLLTLDEKYGYNPHGDEPRMAIGQVAPLSYVLVLAEGRSAESKGVTHTELANFMFDLGCMQAFNLDGGNSATMVFNGGYYQSNRSASNERTQSDLIYFATTQGQR